MGFNFGAFAGGAAKGISQGIEDQARQEEINLRKKDAEWKDKERTRQEDEWARQDALRKKLEGIDAVSFMNADNERTSAINKQNAANASAGRIAQGDFKNPAASGLMLSGADQPASTFSADTQQRKAAMPIQAAGIANVANPVSLQIADPAEARKGLYTAALDAQYPKQQAASEIPLKTSPSLSNHIEAAMQVLAEKQKHGMDTSMDQLKLQKMSDELDKEGATHALALFHGGDFKGGLHELNNNGKHVGWKIEGQPQQTEVDVGGVKVPSYTVNLVNDKGDKRTINTAPDMYATMDLKDQISGAQKSRELGIQDTKAKADADAHKATAKYQEGMLGVARQNADTKGAIADAKVAAAEDKTKKGESRRLLVNDGVKQLDAAYGVRRDPVTNMIDPNSIKDKAGYYRDSKDLEARVNAGESPMAVADDLADKAMRKQKLGGAGQAAPGTPKKLW